MLILRKPSRLFLHTLMVGSALTLAACQTTGTTGPAATAKDPVDMALERSKSETPSGGRPESLASIEPLYKRDSMNPDLAVRYARALRDNGRMTRAAMVLNPLIENPKTKTVGVVTEYAAIQASMGNYETAEKYARSAVMLDPASAQAYHVLGIALDAQGFNKQAEVSFRKALDNWSGDPSPVLNNLGLNLAAQGFLDEAISTLRRAAALSPDKMEIERNLRIVQALQVQPGTASVPFAQTKAAQAAKKEPAPAATAAPVEVKPESKPKSSPSPKVKPAPDTEKSGDIVVEDLNKGDKEAGVDDSAPEPAPAKKTSYGFNE